MLAGVRVHLLWSLQAREFETKLNDAGAAKNKPRRSYLSLT